VQEGLEQQALLSRQFGARAAPLEPLSQVLVWLLRLPHAVVQGREEVALTALPVPWLLLLAVSHGAVLVVETLILLLLRLCLWVVTF
jgi:hypothetical protein